MLENKEEMLHDDPTKTFYGVYFVLLGFDLITEEKIRSKLVDGGGVDVGRCGPDCTHVIVGELVYDDPVCVAARHEGKTLVTGLWVDHSFDIGMPVDPASIIYRPLRDLNGIPGAKSLIVCLTGYQRQDREDIMTMVGLMGANFSKPLAANKVTHLICYKFEGEKYELAKKMKKIKLVNHRWLEDCLRAWELLPEADYDKSGHELETMEAQAKDSEDEAEDVTKKQHGDSGFVSTPQNNSRCGLRSPSQTLMMMQGASRNMLDVGTSRSMSDAGRTDEILFAREETTPNRIQLKETPNRLSEISGSITPGIEGRFSNGASLNSLAKSAISENVSSDLTDRNSHPSSASKLRSMSYSRRTPSRASLPLDLGQVKNNAGIIPMVDTAKLCMGDTLNISPSQIECDRTISNGEHTPSNETSSHPENAEIGKLPEKRKVGVSSGSSKLQKKCHDSDLVLEPALGAVETEMPLPTSLMQGPHDTTTRRSPQNNHLGVNADFDPCPANVSGIVTPEIVKECSEKAPQTSLEKLKSISLDSKFPEATDVLFDRPEDTVDAAIGPQHGAQNPNVPSPGAGVKVQKSDFTANLDFPIGGGDDNSRTKPLKRKLLSRKTFGTKPSFGRGKALNQKGCIYMNKKVSPQDSVTRSLVGEENDDVQWYVDSETLMVSPNCNVDQAKNVDMESLLECGNQASSKTGFVENEAEASEDKENGLDTVICEGVSGDIHTPNAFNRNKETEGDVVDMIDKTVISGGKDVSTKAENFVSDKKLDLCESNLEGNASDEKKISMKKRPLVETKKKKLSPVTKVANSKKGEPRKGAKCKAKCEKAGKKNEKGSLADRNMKPTPEDTGKISVDMEKENRHVHMDDNNLNHIKLQVGKVTANSDRKPTESEHENPDLVSAGQIPKEPVWFILSGHKLQRKEFQQVIKRLKGRVCRDNHQWSYQATHFIVPDPIRRTEKFFAAAASGRWILKTDYLTACNEAGKFLAEEPYEWHKNGLSVDGAINLEAPRKWRLLREKTGHGVLYGMRIIIYGDCIVPPLDTLKRVVRAGDGTILATSPPYTRSLQSDIDFAIVSPGMPRVDIWIQEFLRHEIPCVLADYLVEYVCKPGYSLDRHVQYNTHAWAEKSFKKLESRMNEIVEGMVPQSDDIPCQVCGSCDRGEAMLICGDEGGSRGCGIGTHIDCCDPPLQEIPEEDWFCSECSSKNSKKISRKLTSAYKKKR